MFTGTQLRFGIDLGKDAAKGAATAAVKQAAPGLVELYAAIKDFIVECADIAGIDELVEALGIEAVQNLIGEVVPYFSIAYSSGKLLKATTSPATRRTWGCRRCRPA